MSEHELNEPDERADEDGYALDRGNLDPDEKEQEEDLERERSAREG